ncbi:MAG: FAD-dependent oxidoreductase, partial [Gammaproteobacteria bacterium]|nr:FAD-dependent oxidoreductase [Gammaproteobacteria bacterium]
MNNLYDVLIIGGGINGCGVARDATARGYSVYLADK